MKMPRRDKWILAALGLFMVFTWTAIWLGAWSGEEFDTDMEGIGFTTLASAALRLVVVIVITAIYLIPTGLAFYREHPNAVAIAVVNVVLGLAVGVGWIAALIWTLVSRNVRKERVAEEKRQASLALARSSGAPPPVTFQD